MTLVPVNGIGGTHPDTFPCREAESFLLAEIRAVVPVSARFGQAVRASRVTRGWRDFP